MGLLYDFPHCTWGRARVEKSPHPSAYCNKLPKAFTGPRVLHTVYGECAFVLRQLFVMIIYDEPCFKRIKTKKYLLSPFSLLCVYFLSSPRAASPCPSILTGELWVCQTYHHLNHEQTISVPVSID